MISQQIVQDRILRRTTFIHDLGTLSLVILLSLHVFGISLVSDLCKPWARDDFGARRRGPEIPRREIFIISRILNTPPPPPPPTTPPPPLVDLRIWPKRGWIRPAAGRKFWGFGPPKSRFLRGKRPIPGNFWGPGPHSTPPPLWLAQIDSKGGGPGWSVQNSADAVELFHCDCSAFSTCCLPILFKFKRPK